jgi:cytoskeletal protein RodZ
MSSVGAYLRQLREARGVSLEEIARTTRVNAAYLTALEADDFSVLPPPVFARGFIRAYCQALGEAPEQALALFGPVPAPAGATPSPTPGVPGREGAAAARSAGEAAPRNRGPVLVSFILLIVLGIALFVVTLALQSGREPGQERAAARSTAVAPGPSPPGVAAPATVPPPPSAPATPAPRPTAYRLVARTVEPTWIRVRTEEGKTTEETIPAGQTREWVSQGRFTLTVGNAGGVSLELNGRALPPLGASGAVIPRLVVPTDAP